MSRSLNAETRIRCGAQMLRLFAKKFKHCAVKRQLWAQNRHLIEFAEGRQPALSGPSVRSVLIAAY